MRVDSSDNIYFIGHHSGLVKLTSAGVETWRHNILDSTVQYNDLEINSDSTITLAGHQYRNVTETNRCWFRDCGAISGIMTKTKTDGTIDWSKNYGNYKGGVNQFAGIPSSDPALVYTECWGFAKTYASDLTTHNGYALACGSGIEGCPVSIFGRFKPGLWNECRKDPRTAWRALTLAVDLNGETVWYR